MTPSQQKDLSPAQQAIALGCESLGEVHKHTGVKMRTLDNWANDWPKGRLKLFRAICRDTVASRKTTQ